MQTTTQRFAFLVLGPIQGVRVAEFGPMNVAEEYCASREAFSYKL